MEDLSIKLDDLPDEILIFILRKLHNVDVLYSLTEVNKRLNSIAHDSVFTSHLALTYFRRGISYRLSERMLDRFCSQILPSIHCKIKWLNLEPTSMRRIFLAADYPNLYGLRLNFTEVEQAICFLTDDTNFTNEMKRQILSLVIHINRDKKVLASKTDVNKRIFTRIFSIFANLQHLSFGPSSNWHQRFEFAVPSPNIISSNLFKLHISVVYFSGLLYLLDGRFNQLHTLHVNISRIKCGRSTIPNREKLPNLRCFSLHCDTRTLDYDRLIVPLLHRMLNLEKLDLNLKVDCPKGFVNGYDLKENIINFMPRLNKFVFNIRSLNHRSNQMNLPSNKDIQHTFKDFKDQVISCVDFFQEERYGYCHIYSYPYGLKSYDNISNNFPGGLFKYVHKVSLYDEYPFEYDFFFQISQSFPFMKELTVTNTKPQKNKFYRKSKNGNQDLSIIKYPYLTCLDLFNAHDDYVEQFLVDTETSLPNYLHLSVDSKALKRVTKSFTRNTTRINSAKLRSLHLYRASEITQHVKDYFSQTNITNCK